MHQNVSSFGRIARDLTKNPLGIIALFIVLVYGIAGVVFGTALIAASRHQCDWPIVWFLVIFPFVVLLVFYRLVTHYHENLYSLEEKAVYHSMTVVETEAKLQQEVNEATANEILAIIQESPGSTNHLDSHKPDTKPKRANEFAQSVELAARAIDNLHLQEKIVLAEKYAIRELEAKRNATVDRHTKILNDGAQLQVDGILDERGNKFAIEIKYLSGRYIEHRLLKIADAALQINAFKLPALIVLVFDGVAVEKINYHLQVLQNRLRDFSAKAQIEYFVFSDLIKKYDKNNSD